MTFLLPAKSVHSLKMTFASFSTVLGISNFSPPHFLGFLAGLYAESLTYAKSHTSNVKEFLELLQSRLNYMYVNNDREIILKRPGLNNMNEAEPS